MRDDSNNPVFNTSFNLNTSIVDVYNASSQVVGPYNDILSIGNGRRWLWPQLRTCSTNPATNEPIKHYLTKTNSNITKKLTKHN